MQGKCVLITGATNGIGKVAALELAKLGAEVVIVGRDEAKTRKVRQDLAATSGNSKISMLIGDLSSFSEVRRVAEAFLQSHDGLDVLLNNAGASFTEYYESADGYEMTFALNHFSYYLMTHLLLDALTSAAQERGEARIINVASSAHKSAPREGLRLEDLRKESGFKPFPAYGSSKLANILFTYELARRLQDTRVTVNAVHPGLVNTGFGDNMKGFMRYMFKFMKVVAGRTPEKGAETLVYLASAPEVAGISGKYWVNKAQQQSSEISYDPEQQRKLWDFSVSATGVG